jgi:hypothetical protein
MRRSWENLSPEDRELVYELEREHFVQTDGAELRELDEQVWQDWVARGKPRPGAQSR